MRMQGYSHRGSSHVAYITYEWDALPLCQAGSDAENCAVWSENSLFNLIRAKSYSREIEQLIGQLKLGSGKFKSHDMGVFLGGGYQANKYLDDNAMLTIRKPHICVSKSHDDLLEISIVA
jgi:hypothetical protein